MGARLLVVVPKGTIAHAHGEDVRRDLVAEAAQVGLLLEVAGRAELLRKPADAS